MLRFLSIKSLVWLALALQLLALLRVYAWPVASFALHHGHFLELCLQKRHEASCQATCELTSLVRQEAERAEAGPVKIAWQVEAFWLGPPLLSLEGCPQATTAAVPPLPPSAALATGPTEVISPPPQI